MSDADALSAAVDRLAAVQERALADARARERRPELEATLAALRRPLRQPHAALTLVVLRAAPRPAAFTRAIPTARWTGDENAATVGCPCGQQVAAPVDTIACCDGCGRGYLYHAGDVRVDYPRATATAPE